MKLAFSSQIKEIDSFAINTLGIPAETLMGRSGEAVASAVRNVCSKGGRVVVLAGKGNNGGDGYAAACLLFSEYKVTVVDESGNPVKGVMVQICKDSCIPARTGENGVAEFTVAEDEGYKVSFSVIPEGYESASEETEFYFEDGSFEMTLTLKAAQ